MRLKKLNMTGLAHIIAPLIVIVIIGGVGSYVAVKSQSHANSVITPQFCKANGMIYKNGKCVSPPVPAAWHTVSSHSTNWSSTGSAAFPAVSKTLAAGSKYRWCMQFKTSGFKEWDGKSGGSLILQDTLDALYRNITPGPTYVGQSVRFPSGTFSYCTPTVARSKTTTDRTRLYYSHAQIIVSKISWQRYY